MSLIPLPSRPSRTYVAGAAILAIVLAAAYSDPRLRADAAVQAQPSASVIPRAEHPRPDFMRADWATLNGKWEFEFDDQDAGLRERWYAGTHPFSKSIVVPYTFQSKLSGIGDTVFHDVVWYRRTFAVPGAWQGRRVLLNFGAVDYGATVWVNGETAGQHRGGHASFALDITDRVKPGENTVVVRAYDPATDMTIPRGKQYWKPKSESIFYTRTTGLWQPVWIEAAGTTRIGRLRITPDVDRSQTSVQVDLVPALQQTAGAGEAPALRLRLTATFEGAEQVSQDVNVHGTRVTAVLTLGDQHVWRPDRPALYDLTVEILSGGTVVDRVQSYFGQRKVSIHDGKVYLNNEPFFLRLALDQGYRPRAS